MRGDLDPATLRDIAAKLPDLYPLQLKVRAWTPIAVSTSLMFTGDRGSTLPLAAVCLNDTLAAITEARYALHEAFAHLVWYREKSPSKPNEPAAVFSGRFYATAVASCLYAGGERLADTLIAMFGIDLSKLPTSGVSRQGKVAQYLAAQMARDPITIAVQSLGTTPEWKKSMELRNRWVHEQPPIIGGMGQQHKRREQWIQLLATNGQASYALTFGGGDEPDYSIDEMVSIVDGALKGFVSLFDVVVRRYEQSLPQHAPASELE